MWPLEETAITRPYPGRLFRWNALVLRHVALHRFVAVAGEIGADPPRMHGLRYDALVRQAPIESPCEQQVCKLGLAVGLSRAEVLRHHQVVPVHRRAGNVAAGGDGNHPSLSGQAVPVELTRSAPCSSASLRRRGWRNWSRPAPDAWPAL